MEFKNLKLLAQSIGYEVVDNKKVNTVINIMGSPMKISPCPSAIYIRINKSKVKRYEPMTNNTQLIELMEKFYINIKFHNSISGVEALGYPEDSDELFVCEGNNIAEAVVTLCMELAEENRRYRLQKFSDFASLASYHYADDSSKEWCHAKNYVEDCRKMLEKYVYLRKDFLDIAKKQLCSLEIMKGF